MTLSLSQISSHNFHFQSHERESMVHYYNCHFPFFKYQVTTFTFQKKTMKEKVWSTPIIATFTLFCPREGRLKHKLRSRTSILGFSYGDQFSIYRILLYRVLKLADDNIQFKCLLLLDICSSEYLFFFKSSCFHVLF